MKTALQQAFSRLEELHPDLFDMHSQRGRTFVNEFHQFLAVEKEQMESAYLAGESKDKEYYNETFNK